MANSSMLSLPSITAPLSCSCCETVDSYSGLNPSRMAEAACDSTPLVQNRSLIPIGNPHMAGASPSAIRASAAAARSIAISGVLWTNAFKAPAPSIAARQLSVSAFDVVSPLRSRSRASARPSLFSSVIIQPPSALQRTLHGHRARFSEPCPAGPHPSLHPHGASDAAV